MIFPYDYYYLWAAGRIASQGANVYDKVLLKQQMLQVGWPSDLSVWGFTHPPWSLWLYLPFSYFSFPVARVVWLFSLALALVLVFFACKKIVIEFSETSGKLSSAALFLSLLTFPPVIKNFAYGQSTLYLVLGLVFFTTYYLEKKEFRAGVCLSLTFLKPHLLFPFYCAFFIREIRMGRLSVLRGALSGFLLQVIVAGYLYPRGYFVYLNSIQEMLGKSSRLPGASLSQVIVRFTDLVWVPNALILFGLVSAICLAINSRNDFKRILVWMVPVSLLTTPYAFLHAYALLVIHYLLLVALMYKSWGEKSRFALFGVGLFGVAIITFIQYEFLGVIIPVVIFLGALKLGQNLGLSVEGHQA